MAKANRPSPPQIMMNLRFDQVSPACAIFIDSGGLSRLLVPDLELLERLLDLLAARLLRPRAVARCDRLRRRATLALRFSALRSPDRSG